MRTGVNRVFRKDVSCGRLCLSVFGVCMSACLYACPYPHTRKHAARLRAAARACRAQAARQPGGLRVGAASQEIHNSLPSALKLVLVTTAVARSLEHARTLGTLDLQGGRACDACMHARARGWLHVCRAHATQDAEATIRNDRGL